ncbi:MAG: PadR family transcriptional regulator [Coprobacillaceae bacterium]
MPKNDTFETEQLTDSAYYILLALLEARHGYAIMKYIEELTDGDMVIGAATMYTLLKKMVKTEYINQTGTSARTKEYRISEKGIGILKNDIVRREKMVNDGKLVFKEGGY